MCTLSKPSFFTCEWPTVNTVSAENGQFWEPPHPSCWGIPPPREQWGSVDWGSEPLWYIPPSPGMASANKVFKHETGFTVESFEFVGANFSWIA